jgi:hypothetical protein
VRTRALLRKLAFALLFPGPKPGAGRRKARIVNLMAEAESRSHRIGGQEDDAGVETRLRIRLAGPRLRYGSGW